MVAEVVASNDLPVPVAVTVALPASSAIVVMAGSMIVSFPGPTPDAGVRRTVDRHGLDGFEDHDVIGVTLASPAGMLYVPPTVMTSSLIPPGANSAGGVGTFARRLSCW